MAGTFIQRTFTAGNRKKFTISLWFKRSKLTSGSQTLFQGRDGSDSYDSGLSIKSDDIMDFKSWNVSSADGGRLKTNRKFKDVGAWFHVVAIVDTENVTSGDRVQLWINGVRETSFSTETYPASGVDWFINKAGAINNIGSHAGVADANCWDGSMSHLQFYDGYAYTASDFGEFDATSGIWKIKTSGPSATYGTNGFFMKMEDSSNMDLDSSSNALTFTTTGTLTATKDNPSNNFATWNPLYKSDYAGQNAPIYGNTGWISAETSTNYPTYCSTLGVSAGKWYFETYIQADAESTSGLTMGIADGSKQSTYLGDLDTDYVYYGNTGVTFNGGTGTAYGATLAVGDILGCAVDLDNLKIYWSKNGVWQNSGDPTSGATGTGSAYTMTAPSLTNTGVYMLATGDSGNANTPTCYTNFGNGYFGTTAVTSANADDAGIGSFEYDVPTGYYALCTKNIKAYGG